MSFIDDIVSVGKTAVNWLTGTTGGSLVSTILTGYALNRVTSSINKSNEPASTSSTSTTPTPDAGQKFQIPAAGENRIPVVYGSAVTGGIITDAHMSTDNQVMHYVITISEVTGTLLSDSTASEVTFTDIFWNNNRIVFSEDGITAAYMADPNGNIDRSIAGLVQIYCYSNGSSSPVVPDNYTNELLEPAYMIMPGWNDTYLMGGLVFAIVRVEYNREKGVTGVPNMQFAINNSMTLPGDCLFDYMTNTRYGAGIAAEEIKDA